MDRNRHCLALVILACLVPVLSVAQSDFAKSMKNVFGAQYAGYQWLDYPLDNYGLATMYQAPKPSGASARKVVYVKPVKVVTLCPTFDCLGINPVPAPIADTGQRNTWLYLSAKPDGSEPFAAVGCGSNLSLRDFENKSTIAVNALLPTVLKALKISGSFTDDRTVKINGDISVTCDRRLLPSVMTSYLRTLKDDRYGIAQAFEAGSLIVIEQDLVIQNFTLTVTRGSALAAKLDAGQAKASAAPGSAAGSTGPASEAPSSGLSNSPPPLKGTDSSTPLTPSSPAGQSGPPASSNPSASASKGVATGTSSLSSPGITVDVTKNNSGDYVLKTTSPLIVGILARQEPRGAGAGGASFMYDVSKWSAVPIVLPKTLAHP